VASFSGNRQGKEEKQQQQQQKTDFTFNFFSFDSHIFTFKKKTNKQ
jgi:hypothetical protein